MTKAVVMTHAKNVAIDPQGCQYCGQLFRKLSTLSAHLCEPKRRAQQEKDVGVQIGFRSWVRFLDLNSSATKKRSYQDFSKSPYYSAFVKFGQYCVSVRAVSVENYLDWLLKNNKKLDHWTHDSYYEQWLQNYLRRESVQDALERSLCQMQDYAHERPDLKNGFRDYFRYGNHNRIMYHVMTGHMSPWVIYNCDTGAEFLASLSEEQVALIFPWLDADQWSKIFRDRNDDVQWARTLLKEAGL
jgi:hypothetical protein